MKAIIPVAGAGTKLRPLTYTQPKALMPIAGNTILGVIIDQLLSGGITEFVFVIGYLGEKVQDYVSIHYPNINSCFVVQNDRKGTAHAINLAKNCINENEEVIIVFGDTICDFDIKKVCTNKLSLIGVQKVEDPRNFGVAEIDSNNRITQVIEKPIIPKSNMAMVGVYVIKESKVLFEALDEILKKTAHNNKEYPLTSAIDLMIKKYKVSFEAFKIDTWFDCGKKDSLLNANAILLKRTGNDIVEHRDSSILIHPVYIAKDSIIKNSIIGPNVTIGEHTKIEYAIIKNSIIGSYAELEDVLLHGSIIGNDTFVKGGSQSLNIGDDTEIDLS